MLFDNNRKRLLKSFNIQSKKFGIETEIMTNIVTGNLKYIEKKIDYKRRRLKKGKKFNIFDVYEILKIMILKRYADFISLDIFLLEISYF